MHPCRRPHVLFLGRLKQLCKHPASEQRRVRQVSHSAPGSEPRACKARPGMQGAPAGRRVARHSVRKGGLKVAHAAPSAQVAAALAPHRHLLRLKPPAGAKMQVGFTPTKQTMAAIAAPLAVAAPRRADSSLASTSRIACRALLQRSIAALNTRRPALAAATPRTAPLVQAAQTYLGDAPPGTTGNKLALELPTADLQRSVQFTALRRPSPRGTAILVASVEPGSASAAAGVKPGLELLGLSDPVRVNEVRCFAMPAVQEGPLRGAGMAGGGGR